MPMDGPRRRKECWTRRYKGPERADFRTAPLTKWVDPNLPVGVLVWIPSTRWANDSTVHVDQLNDNVTLYDYMCDIDRI